MIVNYTQEVIFNFLYTAPILACFICGNLFSLIFRWFQRSLPLSENLLLNVLFSHLTIIWQAANIISATFLLSHLVYHVNNPLFSCTLQHLRYLQVIIFFLCFSFFSFAGFLAHSRSTSLWTKCQKCYWNYLNCIKCFPTYKSLRSVSVVEIWRLYYVLWWLYLI